METFEKLFLDVVRKKWRPEGGGVGDKEIYDELIATGHTIPEHAMKDTFENLVCKGLVTGARMAVNMRDIGGFSILWVDPSIL